MESSRWIDLNEHGIPFPHLSGMVIAINMRAELDAYYAAVRLIESNCAIYSTGEMTSSANWKISLTRGRSRRSA
jgi:hypothetical protein